VMGIRSEAGVLGVDHSRGQRQQQRGQGRGAEPDQAVSDTAIGARRSGTIGSSGG
jgi:hypothetical protein